MIKYIGDTHFGHANVIKHDQRPFSSIDEMDRELIKYWNDTSSNKDEIYIDGDFFFRGGKPASWYLEQLKGRKHLIIGNHDKQWLKEEGISKYFVEIKDMITVKDNGRTVVISHYPIAEWDGYFRGYYHVYAHIHNNTNETYNFMKTKERALNCGCMINNYVPVTLDELIINNKIFRENN